MRTEGYSGAPPSDIQKELLGKFIYQELDNLLIADRLLHVLQRYKEMNV
jgi:hypothetical protein